MASEAVISSNLALVARKLEGDIRSRGLQSGDRYLSVADAALLLGVSPATAHRAMDLLVDKRLLVRQHGRGTFIGEGIGRSRPARVRTVHILFPEDMESVTPVQAESLVSAVRRRVGGVNVQFSFVPVEGSLDFVREIIQTAQSSGQLAGVIAISCGREIYRYLEQSGVPMVVLGTLYHDQQHIPSVDVDYRQAGLLLANYLVKRGHKRMALLAAGEGRPGDHAFYDGISDALTEARLPHNALAVRIFPRDFDAFRAQLREMLSRKDRPTAVICASERLVGIVCSVADSEGLSVPTNVEVVFQGQSLTSDEDRFVRAEPKLSFAQMSDTVADMLKQVSEGQRLAAEHVVVPAELRQPGKG